MHDFDLNKIFRLLQLKVIKPGSHLTNTAFAFCIQYFKTEFEKTKTMKASNHLYWTTNLHFCKCIFHSWSLSRIASRCDKHVANKLLDGPCLIIKQHDQGVTAIFCIPNQTNMFPLDWRLCAQWIMNNYQKQVDNIKDLKLSYLWFQGSLAYSYIIRIFCFCTCMYFD